MIQLEEYEGYKYVRLHTGEIRFVKMVTYREQHKDLVKDGEVAVSAGLIAVLVDEFVVLDKGSFSLGIKDTMDDDTGLIENLTGKKFKRRG